MRLPGIRPVQTDTFMHVYNRIAGSVRDFPFGKAEKEQFIRRGKKGFHSGTEGAPAKGLK